jgi:hypothetical protein
MNEITTVGVDLAKDLIVVCAGDAQALWSAEIRSGPSDGVRCYEYGIIRECSAPYLLSCEW